MSHRTGRMHHFTTSRRFMRVPSLEGVSCSNNVDGQRGGESLRREGRDGSDAGVPACVRDEDVDWALDCLGVFSEGGLEGAEGGDVCREYVGCRLGVLCSDKVLGLFELRETAA